MPKPFFHIKYLNFINLEIENFLWTIIIEYTECVSICRQSCVNEILHLIEVFESKGNSDRACHETHF